MNVRNAIILLVAAVLVGLGVAVITVDSQASTAAGVTRHYTLPCYKDVRAAHPNVPSGKDVDAYFRWHDNPANRSARDAYKQDLRNCKAAHEARYGKWNWDSMILVKITEE